MSDYDPAPADGDLLLRAARGERTERPPVWLMRQAGRYLPEYRDLREQYSFLEAISTPEVAAEITLQPYERFRPDGVVMYSDILTVLEPLGLSYRLESGVGPVVENPVDDPAKVPAGHADVTRDLDYVAALLDRLDERVDDAAVVGFAGGPFTLASYAVAGEPDKNHVPLRRFRARHPDAFGDLLERFADVTVDYLRMQVAHGADVVQVFDTYAGHLTRADHREFLLPLHRRLVEAVDVPVVLFVRDAGGRLDLLQETGADVVSLGWTVDMARARERLGDQPVQGNLDPSYLLGDPEFVRERTREVIRAAGPAGHVLNLGHGLHRSTPVESVRAFVETAKSIER
ncbi:uroporphyrinogen decarboxylase [Halobacteriales archaeon SW_12_71_31]|nr:MAG: uroporphyrinogen decarboxylase [Halobacteriales archaeon SW_12_71_31]